MTYCSGDTGGVTTEDRYLSALPMYDLPELRESTRALWRGIAGRLRRRGVAAPEELARPDALDAHWRDPRLLLSQSCGYPLLELPATVRVVATPVYAAPGCAGACYRSAIVVRAGDGAAGLAALRGRICAVNDRDSNSGMNLLRAEVALLAGGRPFFREVVATGGHAASLAAVGNGRADVAAIDCVTFALLRRHRPALVEPVRVLGWTRASPGLPLITAGSEAVREVLRAVLGDVAADPALAETRRALLIDGFAVLAEGAYAAVRRIEADAVAAGYPELV